MNTFFKKKILLIYFTQRGREQERERHINMWLPLTHPLLGTWPATQACDLTGNPTGDPLVCRPVLNPLSYTSQGEHILIIDNLNTTAEVYALKKWQVCQTCLPLSRFTPQWQLLLIIKCLSFPSTLENFFNLKKIITSKEQGPCLHVFLFLHWTSCTATSLKTFVSFCRGILYKKCLFWFLGQWSAERISIGRCFND